MKPVRIQLKRARGFRLQEASRSVNGLECVKVDRSTIFGNPFKRAGSAQHPAIAFRNWLLNERTADAWDFRRRAEAHLRGKNLACWCSLKPGTLCHADVLLEIANPPPPQGAADHSAAGGE
jgi:Domain of unknown function (DUF4326)